MTLRSKATSVLGYRVLPTSVLAVTTYLAIFVALIVTDTLPSVPSVEEQAEIGVDVGKAYEDLRHITAHPHPYNSHSNDHVREYILGRVREIAEGYPYVHVEDDLTSNASYVTSYGIYFEGTNILVKIDGLDSEVWGGDLGVGGEIGVRGAKREAAQEAGGGVLFSAHYDSVSTAPGATDDGMGVVTLLQLVQYFAENRMRRTAVFNINNGEEDWLNGAHAFLEHPWSNLTDTFLNLEGAAAGGRPILFRATSTRAVRSFLNTTLIPHPHANVLSSDAFSRGFIRSGTDYSVYTDPHRVNAAGEEKGMEGLDLAFYKGRSRYHTKYDSVPYTLGGEKSLWSMMEVARGVGVNLLSRPVPGDRVGNGDEVVAGKDDDAAVYFDLFKSYLVVFRLANLLAFNIFALTVGPVLLIVLVASLTLYANSREREASTPPPIIVNEENVENSPMTPPLLRHQSVQAQETPHLRYLHRQSPHPGDLSEEEDVLANAVEHPNEGVAAEEQGSIRGHGESKSRRWAGVVWRHAKFWVALSVVAGLQALLMWAYVVIQPFAIYSSPYTILVSFLSLSYLAMTFTLTLPSSLPFYHTKIHLFAQGAYPYAVGPPIPPAQHQKLTIFIHMYFLTWLLLVLSTLGITRVHPGVGTGYLVSIWNASVGTATALAAVEGVVLVWLWDAKPKPRRNPGGASVEVYDELEGEQAQSGRTPGHLEDPDPDERTPLMHGQHTRYPAGSGGSLLPSRGQLTGYGYGNGEQEEGGPVGTLATWWWILQFLVSVPVPVVLTGHVLMVVLDGMNQTLSDGGSAWTVYGLTGILSFVLILPLAPFSYKLRPFRPLTFFVLLVFVLSTLYACVMFPFSVEQPLKIYFQQSVRLPLITPNASSAPVAPLKVYTTLTGPSAYLRPALLPYLPSSQEQDNDLHCIHDQVKLGLESCVWESGVRMMPVVGSVNGTLSALAIGSASDNNLPGSAVNGENTTDDATPWKKGEFFRASVLRTGRTSGRVTIRGRNTRSCRVYFDTTALRNFSVDVDVDGDAAKRGRKGMQKGYEVPEKGVSELRLWSRRWEAEWVVDVDWGNRTTKTNLDSNLDSELEGGQREAYSGRVACEFNEYESALVDSGPLGVPRRTLGAQSRFAASAAAGLGVHVGSETRSEDGLESVKPKIPALEEVLAFLPDWAVVSKSADGLVEVWAPFEM